ncbi:MAG: hypothetical protein GY929_24440 [Actinomycetia bacterium]|nr:hypothetical protein [Actinomycetes bacterium]
MTVAAQLTMTLLLTDPWVSRRHLELRPHDGRALCTNKAVELKGLDGVHVVHEVFWPW